MFKASMVAVLLGSGLFACTQKPVEQTTTHTNVSTKSNNGDVNNSDTVTTTTDKADGTQTVKSVVTTERTVPAGAPTPAPTH